MLTGTAAAMLFSQSVLAFSARWPPHQLLSSVRSSASSRRRSSLHQRLLADGCSDGPRLFFDRAPAPGNLASMSLATGSKAQARLRASMRSQWASPRHRPNGGDRDLQRLARRPYWVACLILAVLPPRDPRRKAQGHARRHRDANPGRIALGNTRFTFDAGRLPLPAAAC